MRKAIAGLVFCLFVLNISAQKLKRPKLVVGIMVDQMRWDFLYRYYDRYGSDGFKRLMREGFNCENTFIPFTPTYTAAGHSCVYTGSVPSLHGIAGNAWYDKTLKRTVYCTEDSSVTTVGSASSAGKQSPKNLWANTITDELRMAQNFRSKTIAISLKDRGAILPGGHTANGSYWFDNTVGGWISSDFYMKQLPQWMVRFNERKLPDVYLKQNWKTIYPINTYINSTADAKPYESNLTGEDKTFDHITDNISTSKYESFKQTPYGNTYTFEAAKAAVEGEGLGKGGATDFLAISFSSPDYAGHAFGPNSVEIEDMYLRFDKELGAFLKFLDLKIGKGQYTLFLTADHGVAQIPGFLKENKMPAGVLDDAEIRRQLNERIQSRFNIQNAIEFIINYQVHLNDAAIEDGNKERIKLYIIEQLLSFDGIASAFDLHKIALASIPEKIKTMATNGYNQKRSGDIQFIFKPQWFDGGATGTTHGTWNPYDTHIPLLWFGWGIKQGKTYHEVYMTDIAPTLAALLKIQMPNASIGNVIQQITSPNPSKGGASLHH